MSTLIYFDACVFLNYIKDEEQGYRDIGDIVRRVLNRTIDCEFSILISKWLLHEVEKNLTEEFHKSLWDAIYTQLKDADKIEKVGQSRGDLTEARNRVSERSHWHDNLHGVLAAKGNAEILVTSNPSDFVDVEDLITIRLPDNI